MDITTEHFDNYRSFKQYCKHSVIYFISVSYPNESARIINFFQILYQATF